MKLKIEILKKIPLNLYGRKKFYEDSNFFEDLVKISNWIYSIDDSKIINSIYLDDEEINGYEKVIKEEEGAELYR
jgi:SPX domain protein involved in polyphosphate accumulation